jgi:hypothetical protein
VSARHSWTIWFFAVPTLVALGSCSRAARDAPARPVASVANKTADAAREVALAPSRPSPRRPGDLTDDECGDPGDVLLFVSPEHPWRGQPLRAVAVTDHAVDATLVLGSAAPSSSDAVADVRARQGGPPYFWTVTVSTPPAKGTWKAAFVRGDACGGASLVTRSITLTVRPPAPPLALRTSLWPTRRAWSASYENLYSAWIQHLFDAPAEDQPTWSALHEVMRDGSRNFLLNHFGVGEDEEHIALRPDCADLPYFLRAYFANKLLLPFAWSRCGRLESGAPPHCTHFATSEDPFPAPDADAMAPPADAGPGLPTWADPNRDPGPPWNDNAKRVGEFFRTTLADAARSGAGRTPAEDEDSDFYPVSLSVTTLRPGTIYGDPYGHVLVVASRLPQRGAAAGVLFAVDGQPDGTVARKRFWRGNFLYAIDPAIGSAGFKRFRPLAREPSTGRLVRPKNAALADYSATDQVEHGVDGFYEKVEDILSPAPLDPVAALLGTAQALEEQVKTRALSVENGRRFLASGHGPAPMPDGETIFETTGEWEDYSTPSRDLRLLVAIDVAREMPARVSRRPARYIIAPSTSPDALRADLEQRLAHELRERTVTYTRTDGSPWRLSLADIVARQEALEVAYDPNDCVELRWGAPPGSDEASTCVAHAPPDQRAKMQSYRAWFHDRSRPLH